MCLWIYPLWCGSVSTLSGMALCLPSLVGCAQLSLRTCALWAMCLMMWGVIPPGLCPSGRVRCCCGGRMPLTLTWEAIPPRRMFMELAPRPLVLIWGLVPPGLVPNCPSGRLPYVVVSCKSFRLQHVGEDWTGYSNWYLHK
jgi:hypothetical protein